MRIKKILVVLSTLFVLVMTLSGCVAEVIDTKISEDDTGTLSMRLGVDKSLDSEEFPMEKTDDTIEFEYKGNSYIGKEYKTEFKSLDELNLLLNDPNTLASKMDLDTTTSEAANADNNINSSITVSKDNDDYILNLEIKDKQPTETVESDESEEIEKQIEKQIEDAINSEIEKDPELNAELEEAFTGMADSMVVEMNIEFPYNVALTNGSQAGVSIDGKIVTFDFSKIKEGLQVRASKDNKSVTITAPVSTETKPEEAKTRVNETLGFADVVEGAWYVESVKAMIDSGLMHGMGNGTFAPNENLTYAQFCTILANALGIDTSKNDNKYWAYTAISEIQKAGYCPNLGEIRSENYDRPITRQVAIAEMSAFMNDSLESAPASVFGPNDIPDYETISPEYQIDILIAYDLGITHGIDHNGTFNPKGVLTRAQICQLFYNVGLVGDIAKR